MAMRQLIVGIRRPLFQRGKAKAGQNDRGQGCRKRVCAKDVLGPVPRFLPNSLPILLDQPSIVIPFLAATFAAKPVAPSVRVNEGDILNGAVVALSMPPNRE